MDEMAEPRGLRGYLAGQNDGPGGGALMLPLANRQGDVIAYALIDAQDSHLAAFRWSFDGRYVSRLSGPRRVRLHRLVLGLAKGDGLEGDHVNRDPLDNRRCNLRVVTHAQNAQNQGPRGTSSRHRGVGLFKRTGRWRARVKIDGTEHHLGYFSSEEEAHAAAVARRCELLPFTVEGDR
jgi:hypothetical protein